MTSKLKARIGAYLPNVVRRHLKMVDFEEIPASKNYESVVMFADVSGFTSMTESLAARGPAGAECLGKYLNSYFEQMLKIIFSEGIL